MKRLENKVAIITGGSGGMGKTQAELFAKEGAKVVIGDIASDAVEKVAKEINNDGGQALGLTLDISSEESWQAAVKKVIDEFGKIDILVNTAGIVGPAESKAADHDLNEWNKVMAINLTGAFLGTKYAIPEMIKAGGGSIVTISSIAAVVGQQGGTGYGSAKAGLLGLTKNIASDYGKDNIRANAILPGQIKTPMSAFLETEEAKDIKKTYIDKIPLGYFGDPIDIANGALFLASDDSKYITGNELYIDGGVTIR